jgi:hypothetical protein
LLFPFLIGKTGNLSFIEPGVGGEAILRTQLTVIDRLAKHLLSR